MKRIALLGAIMFGALMTFGSINPATAQNCATPDLRSSTGVRPATTLTFVNRGPESRRILWIDFKGARKFYKEIGAGQSHTQSTFVGHAWIAAREDDRCQTVVIARAAPLTVDVTRSCLTGSIDNSGACAEGAPPPQGANTSGCEGGSWRGNLCVCPRGKLLDAGRCVSSGGDHGGVNCAASGLFYDGISCVRKCPAGTVGRNGVCQ